MKKVSILLISVLTAAFAANATSAKRGYHNYTQPDGSTISLELRGSQHAHFYVTDDNVPVMCDNDGFFRYIDVDAIGNIMLSEVPAQNSAIRSTKGISIVKGISLEKVQRAFQNHVQQRLDSRRRTAPQNGLGLFTTNYPRTGKVRSLVFLVEYKDVKFTTPNPAAYFDRMLNEENFSEDRGTGSARDYFLDQSNGRFDVHFDVVGPVTLSQNRRYYGGNNAWGDDQRAEEMVTEAAAILNSEINFADYDYDNNGKVDNIFVIYAGMGEASGGPAESVWPHAWEVPNGPTLDGKLIYGYACHNEMEYSGVTGIGGVCHEFSHVMGLPDLYSTSAYLTCTPDVWDVMDAGNYNNDSRTPPNYSAFERNAMQWLDPIVLDGADTVVLDAIDKSNTAYLIPTENTNEFFLLENRQQNGWDKYLPNHGLLIWHIDFNQKVWDDNVVNNNSRHQYVDIEEANNNPNSSNTAALMGYTYPGTTKSTSFTSTTSPALKSWGNKGIDLPITEITETADGYISFNVQGGKIDIDTPLAPEVEALDNGTINIKWQAVEKVTEYLLNIYTKDAMGNKSVFEQYTDYSVGNVTEHAVEGVSGNTTYYVTVTGANGRNRSDASPETVVTTPELKFIYTTPVALDGSSTDDNEVTLNWLPLDGAVKYLLTIEAEVIEGEETIKVDFGSNDTLVLPEGWVWSGAETDIYKSTSTGYYGEASPALKFASSGLSLTSPVMRGNISKVSFWLRGASANSSSSFSVDGRYGNDDKWLTLYSIISLATMNSKGDVLEFEPTAGNIRQLRFIYTKSSGNAALDDVSLTIPAAVYKPLDDHNRTDVGNITEYTTLIDGTPARIRFYVEAQNAAGETSRRSNIVTIDLKQADGVSDVLAIPASVTTYGNTVAVNAEANTPVQIYNISGTTVAQTTTDAEGKASFTLPAGFYIVATQSAATKVIVK